MRDLVLTTNTDSRVFIVRQFIKAHLLFILILIVATIVWSYVFSLATTDFITGGTQPYRAVWNGSGPIDIFGFTIEFNFE